MLLQEPIHLLSQSERASHYRKTAERLQARAASIDVTLRHYYEELARQWQSLADETERCASRAV